MQLAFNCPHCQAKIKAPESLKGKLAACPQCKLPIHIPPREVLQGVSNLDSPIDLTVKNNRTSKRSSPFKKYWLATFGIGSIALVCIGVFLSIFLFSGILGVGVWVFLVGLVGCVVTLLAAMIRGTIAYTKRTKDAEAQRQYRVGLLALFVSLSLAFCGSIHSERVGVTMLHYASLISAIFILGLYASLVVNRKWLIKTGLGIALVFTIVWWNVDYSVQNWSTEGESDEWTLRYKDYVRRGSSRPYYREFSMTKRDSYLVTYKSEGAMTETGKQHGKWMWHSFDWDAASGSDSRFDSGNDFYWYGDKITEGEWHLREK